MFTYKNIENALTKGGFSAIKDVALSRGFFLVVVLFVSFFANAEESWHIPSSELRLKVEPRFNKSHTARIDLPDFLRKRADKAVVFADNGEPLAIRVTLTAGDDQDAVLEIFVPERISPMRYFLVYFPKDELISPEKEKHTAINFNSFALFFNNPGFQARPHSFSEVFSFSNNVRNPPFIMQLDELPDKRLIFQLRRSGHSRRRKMPTNYRYRLETLLNIENRIKVRFGVPVRESAWFVILDQRPLFAWKDYDKENEGMLISPPVILEPGLRNLNLYVFQKTGEPSIELKWKSEDEIFFKQIINRQVVSSIGVKSMIIEFKDNQYEAGFRYDSDKRITIPSLDQVFFVSSIKPLSNKWGLLPELYLDDEAVKRDGVFVSLRPPGNLEMRLGAGKRHKEENYNFPFRLTWNTQVFIEPDFVFTDIQRYVKAGKKITINGGFADLPDFFNKNINQDLKLRWETKNYNGTESRGEIILESASEGDFSFTLNWPEAVGGEIRSALYLGDIPLTKEKLIKILSPDVVPSELKVRGRHLKVGNAPAVLLLKDIKVSSDSLAEIYSPIESIIMVDEFWGSGLGPEARLCPVSRLESMTDLETTAMYLVDSTASDNAMPELIKFNLLSAALEEPSDAIIWSVGVQDLMHHNQVQDLLNQLRFLINASLAVDKLPILVTIPSLPDVAEEDARAAAIGIKQLGVDYGIPVIDVYSQAHSRFAGRDEVIKQFFTAEDGTLRLGYPNNKARQWFSELILQAVLVNSNDKSRNEGG